MLRQASPHSWTGEYAVEAVDLVKDFAEKRAVDGVSLSVPTGSIFGMLGPNGAGKTTTLRMILGIIEPSSGERRVLGCTRPIEAAHRIGYLPEERGLYPAMNAREAIAFMGALRGLPIKLARSRADELLEQNGLGDWAKKPIRTLSKGMAQTVQLLGTLVHEPRLIVLDEPFSGLDAINQGKLERLIRNRAADGVTIIFSTHVIAHAERPRHRELFPPSRAKRGRRVDLRASGVRARTLAQGADRGRCRHRNARDRAPGPARSLRRHRG